MPQDPTKTFAPDFIKDIPKSAALVSYRVVTTTGDVFPAADGAALIPPADSRLDVTVADKSTGARSDVTIDLTMRKNRAAVEVLKTQIPAGYIIGGQSLSPGVEVGKLDVFFDVDNPWKPGHVLKVSAPVLATGRAHMWEVSPNYSTAISQSNGDVVDTVKGAIQSDGVTRDLGPSLTHTLDVAPATTETPGTLTLTMDRSQGAQVAHNESRETWALKIFGYPNEDTNFDALVNNPTQAAVYRWTTEEHSTIQVEDVFELVAGKQAVLIKDPTSGSTVSLDSLAITSASSSLDVDDTLQFTATGTYSDSSVSDITSSVAWSSTNETVGTISSTGLLTALADGNTTIQASQDGVASNTIFMTVSSASSSAPAKLTFLVQPSDTIADGTMSQVKVEIQDAGGSTVTDATDTIILAIGTNPANGTLSGTKVVAAINGVATFSDLNIDSAGTGYTLIAADSASVLLGTVSTFFDITPLPPTLAFLTQPSDTVAGAIIAPAVQVEIQDASGARITDATNTVFISIQSDPNGGSSVLSGTVDIGSGFFQKAAVAGVATFSDLSIDLAASGFSLQAASAGFDPIISDDFDITANTAPTVEITSFSVTSPGLITAAATATDPDEPDGNLVLAWTLTDLNSPFDSFAVNGDTTTLTSFNLTAINAGGSVPNGLYSLTVTATDSSGATSSETHANTLRKLDPPSPIYSVIVLSAGVVVTPTTLTTNVGVNDSFTVALSSIPTGAVDITFTRSIGSESLLQFPVGIGPASASKTVTFAADATALIPQVVLVVGQPSASGVQYTITGEVSSATDTIYDGLGVVTITVN